jgi:hypothetical protein
MQRNLVMNSLLIRFFLCLILLLACPVLSSATFCLAPGPVVLFLGR